MEHTDLLVIGAGPFGLAMSRLARLRGVDHRVLGRPMSFWREHMPDGMLLRSSPAWHLDPAGELTFPRFLDERGHAEESEPLSLSLYIDYAQWVRREAGIELSPGFVTELSAEPQGGFVAQLSSGERLSARRVLLAIGFHAFRHVPEELAAILPAGRWSHTRDFVDLERMRGKRALIVGGRQSAFEWAALLAEAGAERVDVVHRHATPSFAASDWSWVPALLERLEANPSWYRDLPGAERDAITRRFWQEGRLKLEPWLPPRLPAEVVTTRPHTEVEACAETSPGAPLVATLSDGERLRVDHVVLATGYRVDMARVPFLRGPLLDALERRDGSPVLGPDFQSSVPGLFVTSMPAARDVGPYMGFTVSVPYTSRILARALL